MNDTFSSRLGRHLTRARTSWLLMPCIAGALFGCGSDEADETDRGGDSTQGAGSTRDADGQRAVPGHDDPHRGPLYFTEEAGARGLNGRNHCGAEPDSKRYLVEEIGQGCALFDADGDGDLDAFIADGCGLLAPGSDRPGGIPAEWFPDATAEDWFPAFDGKSRLYANDGGGQFEDVSDTAGVAYPGMACAPLGADLDGDGDAEIYLTAWGANRLYRNDGELEFSDVSEESGTADRHWSAGACLLDADRDGRLDVYVVNYFSLSTAGDPEIWEKIDCPHLDLAVACGPKTMVAEPDSLFRNLGELKFEDVSDTSGIRSADARYGLGVVALDCDVDGDTDIYVANDSRGNYLWTNDGSGKFEEYADFLGLSLSADGVPQAGMGVGCADFDDDLDQDLFLTNFAYDDNTLYRNDGATLFRDISRRAGFGPAPYFDLGWGTDFADFDHDGRLDLFVANGHIFPEADERAPELAYAQLNRLFRQDESGLFPDHTALAGPGFAEPSPTRGAAFGDVDHDGDLDLLLVQLNLPPSLLINHQRPADGGFALLELIAQGDNGAAIGAQVVVEFGGRKRRLEVRAGSSFASQHDRRLHVGTGASENIDLISITWPDGNTQEHRNVPVGTSYVIRQSDGSIQDRTQP